MELEWPVARTNFRACMGVIKMEEYTDIDGDSCIRSTGETLLSLNNVKSSAIVPISPSLEESMHEGAETLTTNAFMKVKLLDGILKDLSTTGKCHNDKKTIVLAPIQVAGTEQFVLKDAPVTLKDLSSCLICVPPIVLGKPHHKAAEIQRTVRNHAAAHLLTQNFEGEPCGLCCKTSCRVDVDVTPQNKKIIIRDPEESKVDASAFVHHNCETHDSMEPFEFKFCKAVSGFPSTNKPVFCYECSTENSTQVFVWSYNIEEHYAQKHDGLWDEDSHKYARYLPKKGEKEAVLKAFKINIDDGTPASEE